ncbi:MAG: hypothetical protein K8S27_05180 [Candidatus Omnitrophica bacterium]|nr:hypothetical protein [Candidatus Omnitrophota bacterium]
MPDQKEKLKIVIFAPTEVQKERDALLGVIAELNRAWAQKFGVYLECINRDSLLGRKVTKLRIKTAKVLDQAEECDIYIGVLWTRFSLPALGAGLGSKEEFERVIHKLKSRSKKNKFILYLKDYPLPPSKIDLEQLSSINQLKHLIKNSRGVVCPYYDRDEFVLKVKKYLFQRLQALRRLRLEKKKSLSVSAGLNENDEAKINDYQHKFALPISHVLYRLFNASDTLKEYSLRLSRLLCQYFEAPSSSVIILSKSKKRADFVAQFNGKYNILFDGRKDVDSIINKMPYILSGDVKHGPWFLGHPLILDKVVGYLVIDKSGNKSCFTKTDGALLAFIAEQSAIALNKFQLKAIHCEKDIEIIKFISQQINTKKAKRIIHDSCFFKILEKIALTMNMSKKSIEGLYLVTALHNANVLHVPYDVLINKGELEPEDLKVILINSKTKDQLKTSLDMIKSVFSIILFFKEYYDGTGRPARLKNSQIPLGARILALLIFFERVVGEHPDEPKISVRHAIKKIRLQSGKQLDPIVVQNFCLLYKQKEFQRNLALLGIDI